VINRDDDTASDVIPPLAHGAGVPDGVPLPASVPWLPEDRQRPHRDERRTVDPYRGRHRYPDDVSVTAGPDRAISPDSDVSERDDASGADLVRGDGYVEAAS
jgi:hypothetical protein